MDEWEDYLQQPPTRPRPADDSFTHQRVERMDVFDQIEAEAMTEGGGAVAVFGRASAGGGVAGVLRGLKNSGMSFLDVLKWLPVVLKLVAELGPEIAKIIKLIKDAIDGGKTPQTFAG